VKICIAYFIGDRLALGDKFSGPSSII